MAHKGKMIGSILHDSEGPVDAVVKAESDTAPRDQDSVELETAPCPILLMGQRNAVKNLSLRSFQGQGQRAVDVLITSCEARAGQRGRRRRRPLSL